MLTLQLSGGRTLTVPYARVGGWGPTPASLMLIADSPSIAEGQHGRPFSGKAGGELRRFLTGYPLPSARECYLTYLSRDVRADLSTFAICPQDEAELWAEIVTVRPRVIVAMGAHVVRYMLGDDITLEMAHAIPHRACAAFAERWQASSCADLPVPVIWPSYSPAAMLHAPTLQAVFAYTMHTLGLFLKGDLPAPPRDVHARYYRRLTDPHAIIHDLAAGAILGADTEGWAHLPWCISASAVGGTGIVIRATDPDAIAATQAAFNRADQVVLHNSLHDLSVLRAMGVEVPAGKLRDTMIAAYLLGLEPQGLKPLAYRHAGMRMQEYSELTAEASAAKALIWLMELHDRLPAKAVKLTKRDAIAAGRWDTTRPGKYEPVYDRDLSPDDQERAKAKGLIARMLDKPADTLRKRWADSRAREILSDELGDLSTWEADPPEATLDEIPESDAIEYAARDADATRRIAPHLHAEIKAYGLEDVYATDLAIVPMIDRMQTVGLGCDVPHFAEVSAFLGYEAELNLEQLREATGRDLNPNSGDQVAEWLYGELRLQDRAPNLRIKKTDSGRLTTNDKTLEALSLLDPTVELIQTGREIRKLKSTYADAIPRLIGRDGRLHPRYRITRTDTGRLSAGDPNVLALPKHSARAALIRNGFVAGEGRELGEWDLSQIEICVLAHDSQDPTMLAAIRAGRDLHHETAARMYGKPGVSKEERYTAKAVNFGTIMGITAMGLRDQFHKNKLTHYTEAMCEELLQQWRAVYPGAWAYIQRKHREARRDGYVRDMWGRLRWLEGVHAADDRMRAEAERQAQATPVQSGAQGIIKRVMAAVWPTLIALRQDFWIEPLLQVHDALVLEYDPTYRDLVHAVMDAAMTQTVTLSVPIRSSFAYGTRLGDL